MNPQETRICQDHYLGDGVYASHDGYQIWLRTPREGGWHEIALEPEVLCAFDEYRAKLGREAARDEAEQDPTR